MATVTVSPRVFASRKWLCTSEYQTVGVLSEPEGAHWRHTIYAPGRFRALPARSFVQAPEDSSSESELIRTILIFASSVKFSQDTMSFTLKQDGDYPHSLQQALIALAFYFQWDLAHDLAIRCGGHYDRNALFCIVTAWYVDTKERFTFYLRAQDAKTA